MDIFLQNFLISLTVVIPAAVGLARYYKMDKQYHPLVWICCLLIVSEVLMFVLIRMKIFTHISYNIVLPITGMLYLILFKRWGIFSGKPYAFISLVIAAWVVWTLDHFILYGYRLNSRTSYFRICYSLTLVLMSVTSINRLIVSEKKNLLRNSRFLICIGLTVYYTYRIIVDAFSLKGMSSDFLLQLGNFNRYLLISLNLVFALALLWTPSKKNYTIQF